MFFWNLSGSPPGSPPGFPTSHDDPVRQKVKTSCWWNRFKLTVSQITSLFNRDYQKNISLNPCLLRFFFLSDWGSPRCSCSLKTNLLHCLTCWDAFLLITAGQSGYNSIYVQLNMSAHYPLTAFWLQQGSSNHRSAAQLGGFSLHCSLETLATVVWKS